MRFEILLASPTFERVVLPWIKNLERLGIEAQVRTVDTAQYQQRLDTYDFDMIVASWGQSLSPGNEQRDFWGSQAATTDGTQNYVGIRDPAIDALIDLVISASDRNSLIHRTRALDRVLLWNHYVIPHWHISMHRVAYWDKFRTPEIPPKYSLGVNTWWIDPGLEARLAERKRTMQ
jgi:microcin C transport system substrate-binding protein